MCQERDNLDTRNFLLIYRLNKSSSVQIEYFVEEALARKLANRLYTQGFYDIELLAKNGNNFYSVQRVVQDEDLAARKHAAYINSIANEAYSLHDTLFKH